MTHSGHQHRDCDRAKVRYLPRLSCGAETGAPCAVHWPPFGSWHGWSFSWAVHYAVLTSFAGVDRAHQSGLQRSRPPETKGYQGSDREGLKLPPTGGAQGDVAISRCERTEPPGWACGPTRTSPVLTLKRVGGAIGTLRCA